jgi:hypothetical protein
MANRAETMSPEGLAIIKDAVYLVTEAVIYLGDGKDGQGFTVGDANAMVEMLYPNSKLTTGMGLIPTALDELEAEGFVTCTEVPVNPTRNGQTIGRNDWITPIYHIA